MDSDANPMEVEHIDHVMDPSATSAPVVLVQYRNRGVPLWVMIPLVIVVPLSAILIYHRLVVVRYRTQAISARQALESQINGSQTPVPQPVAPKPPEPLALNSQPIKAEIPLPAAATPRVVPTPESVAKPSVPGPSVGAETQPIVKEATATLPADSVANRLGSKPGTFPADPAVSVSGNDPFADSTSTANANTDSAAGEPTSVRPQSILGNPIVKLGQPEHPATPTEGSQRTAASGKTSIVANEGLPESHDSSTAAPGERVSDVRAENVSDDPFDVRAEALPTKEESLRQIKDEAAKKLAEIEGRDENREAEFRAIRRGERVEFRDLLREALRTFGNNAGPEIDKLASKYGYDQDKDKFVQARYAWKFARMSTESRVRLTRDLDLPETTILNFLSEEIDKQIGSRGGPRNRNEVRIRAAKMLLNFPLPTTDAPSRTRLSGRPSPGVAVGGVAPRAVPPRSAVARSR